MALPVAQLDPRPLIRDLLDSYRTMEMPLDRYLKLYLLPMVLMAVMLAVIAVAAPDLPAWLRGLIAALGGFLPLAVLVMPKAKRTRNVAKSGSDSTCSSHTSPCYP